MCNLIKYMCVADAYEQFLLCIINEINEPCRLMVKPPCKIMHCHQPPHPPFRLPLIREHPVLCQDGIVRPLSGVPVLTLGKNSQIRLAYVLRRVGELVNNFALGPELCGMSSEGPSQLSCRQASDAPVIERPLSKVLCVSCGAVNEEDFQFCKRCGTLVSRPFVAVGDSEEGVRVLGTQGTLKDIPEEAMNKRLSQFLDERISDGYQKKGNAEFRKFELFIHSRGLEGERNIDSDGRLEPRKRQQPSVLRASPRDVLAYLIMKDVDNSGRTLVHGQQCARLGEPNLPQTQRKDQFGSCTSSDCAWRHGGESMRTGVVQLIANGYSKLGVKSVWDPESRTGNPATGRVVGQYIKFSKKEQGLAGIQPKQAAIILRQEAESLVMRMRALMLIAVRSNADYDELVIRMYMAVFMTAFSSTKRGESLCIILLLKIMRLPLEQGLVLNLTWGKTLRDGGQDTFGLVTNKENKWVCACQLIHR